LFLTLAELIIGGRTAGGQISVAPTALYIHDDLNVGSLQVANGNDVAREVSVSFEFGYPSSDIAGRLIMVYDDTLSAERYGLDNCLQAFPRHFILPPGGQQIVRVRVRPVHSRADGVKWTRMIITSGEAVPDTAGSLSHRGIGTRISFIFRQNIVVFHLKGRLTTGIVPGEVKTFVENGKLVVISKLVPEGNSPFMGSVSMGLFDGSGNKVAGHEQTLAVYFVMLNRTEIKLPGEGLKPGMYSLRFEYDTKRSDISSADIVQSEPVRHSVDLQIGQGLKLKK
jgi:hypothetical protein